MNNNGVSVKKNFMFSVFNQLTGIMLPLITTPYISRVLKAQGVGEFSYAYSIANYFYILSILGLKNYGNRTIAYIKDDRHKLSKTFWEIYMFQFLIGTLLSIAYLGYVIFFSHSKIVALVLCLVVISGTLDITWFLYGMEEFRLTSIRDVLIKLLTTLFIFLFIHNQNDVWKYALIYSIGFLFSQVVVIPAVFKKVCFIKPSYKGILSHIKPNLILFLPTIAVSLYRIMDKIMLGTLGSSKEVGYYYSCEKIINVPLALITALGTVMLPRMSNIISHNDNFNELEKTFNKSIVFAMFISSSICLGIMTVADIFVPLFFGEGFEKCVVLFYIILPSCLFLAFANVIRTQYLLPRKRDKLFILSLFSGAAVNLISNFLLIPKLASIGAAIGTLGAEITVCVIQAAYVYEEANIKRNIINSIPFVIAGIVMFLLFKEYVPPVGNMVFALILKIFFSGISYMLVLGIILISSRFIKKDDSSNIMNNVRGLIITKKK